MSGPGAAGSRTRPQHRKRPERTRPIWTVVGVLVAVGILAAIVVRGVADHDTARADPMLVLGGSPMIETNTVVHSTLTLTDGCLSLAEGLVVFPPNSEWDADTQTVLVSHPAFTAPVGQEVDVHAIALDAVPSTASEVVPQSLIDALNGCSRRTGLRSVVFID